MRRFETGSPQIMPMPSLQGVDVERNTPARPAALVADLLVPIGQAAVTGALLGGLVAFVVRQIWPMWAGWSKLWLGLGLTIAAVAWLVLLGQTRKLLWIVETLTGQDLDGDGQTGEPKERIVVVNAGQAQAEAAQREEVSRASQFAQFVAGLDAHGTTARTWENRIGRETYQEFRDVLIRLGWAKWKSRRKDGSPNERRGWVLTQPVGDILERIG